MSFENKPETTYDTVLQLENNIENQDRHQKENEKKIEKGTDVEKIEPCSVDFETAISHTGYGSYNKKMLLFYIPATLTTLFCTSSPSYILPAARCHFDLTPLEEGSLFGAIYVGMVSSAFLWGFFIDTLGRQKLLFYGLLLSAIVEFCSGLVQTFWMLVVLKYISGFITCGPYSLTFTFLSEFYDKKHRDKIVLCAGGFSAFGYIFQPFIAYYLIPMDIRFEFFDGKLVIDNWRIFLMAGSLIIFLAAFLVYFMDESPKFLMAVGRHKEAMCVFQKIYSQNTGNSPESYPVISLKSETIETQSLKSIPSVSVMDFMKKGWTQIKPLFMKPYLTPSFLTFILQMMTMLTLNTFRLRLPKMYAKIIAATGNSTFTVCESETITEVISTGCRGTHALVNPQVYVNSMIIGAATFTMFWVATYITKYINKNHLYIILSLLSGLDIAIFPWTKGGLTLTLSAVYVAIMNINVTLVISVIVSAVPTTLRGMAVNMVMMFGRIGVISGNLIIPTLAAISCELSFMTLALLHFICLFVIVILMRIKKENPKS